MEVFRICKANHAEQLAASGSINRWNKAGQQVIYAGSSRSLSTLELVVHKNSITSSISYKVMVISIADDDALITQIHLNDLPDSWQKLAAYPVLQAIGSDWYENQRSLILKVPSAIIPREYNYVINTEHPEFKNQVRLVRLEAYFWDGRLL